MKKTMLVLLSFILPLTIVSSLTTQTASAADGDYAYSDAAKEALDYVNKIRQEAGLSQVQLDPYLTKAAENHANYLTLNKELTHYEKKGQAGYTGVTPEDRVVAVGGGHLTKTETDYSHLTYEELMALRESDKANGIFTSFTKGTFISEGVSSGRSSAREGVVSLINGPYHRANILDQNLQYLGAGFDSKYLVLNYMLKYPEEQKGYSLYPFDGQKNVELNFFGNEIPDPLEYTRLNQSGYIITHLSYVFGSIETATLVDNKGVVVPIIIKNGNNVGTGLLNLIIPKTILKEETTYTVTINGKASTFTTASKQTTTPTSRYSSTNVGIKLDNSFITVNPTEKVVNGSTFIPLYGCKGWRFGRFG